MADAIRFEDLRPGDVFSLATGEPGRFTKIGMAFSDGGFNAVDWQSARVRYFGPELPVIPLGQVVELEAEVYDRVRRKRKKRLRR